jgi:cytochrome c-type biogenesis protein CcmE
MDKRMRKNGSVILIVVFVIALMSTLVMGIAQINTEELLILNNHAGSSQAVETGYAGLNDAFFELRSDSSWNLGFTDKSFNGGSYSVSVAGSLPDLTVSSTSLTSNGFIANVEADVAVSGSSPYAIRVSKLRINE